ncbi:YidH family protein [Tsukamurella spumae]|uniref:DUF202 domain-containing protein n=1 Tax=Tsukamurella spumae TaxID=44753 RepID=A0A846WWF6_9ACTN|nr:DUF202 domain-containing protein [Tsukamurella spumae]NKY17184.1 DUF202 domain-containing protein [Tsukamurella spumae]
MSARPQRRPDWVYRDGTEPDERFTLANERTYLAWIRTSLALIAGGVALQALPVALHTAVRVAASVLLICAGATIPLGVWIRWGRAERAMRTGEPLPAPTLLVPLAAVVTGVGVLLLVALVMAPGGR